MKFVWLLFVIVCSTINVSARRNVTCSNRVQGYYWRDYTGIIPNDAVPAGKDDTGATTFVGQALHPGGQLTPGVIKRGVKGVSYEFGTAPHLAEDDVKILCSQRPEQLIWIEVDVGDSILNLNGQVIKAGNDGQGPLAIGRKNTTTEVGVGKVLIVGTTFDRLWYTTPHNIDYGIELISDNFEVLVFNAAVVAEEDDCVRRVIYNINFFA